MYSVFWKVIGQVVALPGPFSPIGNTVFQLFVEQASAF